MRAVDADDRGRAGAGLPWSLDGFATLLVGKPLVAYDIEQMLNRRVTLLGAVGLVRMAISGIDMAAWDAQA